VSANAAAPLSFKGFDTPLGSVGSRLSHRTDSAVAYRLGISGCHQTPRALVQNASKYLELAHQGCGVRHRCQYKTFDPNMFYLFCDNLLAAAESNDGLDTRGSPRRNIARGERDYAEQHDYAAEGQWVRWLRSEKE
jgi:hypothetical protein